MEWCLEQGESIRLEGGKSGLSLYCTTGTVWLTKGDGVDYLMSAGKRIELAKKEYALMEALKPSELLLGDPGTIGHMIKPVISLAAC